MTPDVLIAWALALVMLAGCGSTAEPSPSADRLTAQPSAVISAQNAGQLTSLARWGKGTANKAEYSPDGGVLASGSWDRTLRLWQISNGIHLHTARANTDRITSVDFSPDGTSLASGAFDGSIELWGIR
jgi:WD40 repeat protein